MLNHIVCGTFHPEEDDDEALWSTSSTPIRSRRSRDGKNPYSARGLDRFSALLADLEEKRQRIYSEVGSQDISFVRFAYSNSNDCVPIVVKLRDKKQENIKDDNETLRSAETVDDRFAVEAGDDSDELKRAGMKTDASTEKRKIRFSWKISAGDWRQPSFYLPMIIMFILLLLTVFGRSVVVLCTCLGWYLVPAIKGGSSDVKTPATKKKIYVRRKSDKMVVSDNRSSSLKTNNIKAADVSPPKSHWHCHRKSW